MCGPEKGSLKSRRQGAKSLEWNILPLTPLDVIFCKGKFFLALCFQYFAGAMGGGGYQSLYC